MWQSDPATDKQKEKLKFFGCTWDEGITKGQASDALTECARLFPARDREYYNRPATDEQLSVLTPLLAKDGEEPNDYAAGEYLTYGEAKDILQEIQLEQRHKEEQKFIKSIERSMRPKKSREATKMENEAISKLANYGLAKVRVSVIKVQGKMVMHLDADSDGELMLAAQILNIKNATYIP